MADLPLVEIEFRMTLLPPISRGTHLAGPRLHAERLVALWKADGEVSLGQAFRLLDVESVAGAILRTSVERDYRGNPRYWHFPPLADLLPELRALTWQEVLADRLTVEGIASERGKRHRVLSALELPRLSPDWQLSRLMRGDSDRYVDVQVRLPSAAPERSWWKRPPDDVLKAAIKEIASGYAPGVQPTFDEVHAALNQRLGDQVPRDEARNILKTLAPQLIRGRGHRVTKSRKANR